MKYFLLKVQIIIFVLISLYACNDETSVQSQSLQESETTFSIENAKEVFESIFQNYISDCEIKHQDKLFPIDYIPDWAHATRQQKGKDILILCPVNSNCRNGVIGANFTGVKSEVFISKVNQFIAFEVCENAPIQILLKIVIPEGQTSLISRVNDFIPYEQNFSGIVCNYNLLGKLTSVERIKHGKTILQNKGMKLWEILHSIGVIKIIKFEKKVDTRSWGEYDDWDDYYDPHFDDDGNYNPEDEEPDPETNPETDPGTGSDLVGADGLTNEQWFYENYPDCNPDVIPDISDDSSDDTDGYDPDIIVYLRHAACGTYIGSMLLDEIDNAVLYCPTCRKYVYFYF